MIEKDFLTMYEGGDIEEGCCPCEIEGCHARAKHSVSTEGLVSVKVCHWHRLRLEAEGG